jgi:hypothetical protein
VVGLDRDDLDSVLLELGPEGGKLLVLELVGNGERLERGLVQGAQFLRLLDERAGVKFSKCAQCKRAQF